MEQPPEYTPYPTKPQPQHAPPQYQQPQSTTGPQYAQATTQVTGQPIPPPPMPQPGYGPYPAAPPPQSGYTIVPNPQVVNRTVIVQQPVSVFGRSPIQCVCQNCHQNVITSTNVEPGAYTWLMCVVICLFFGIFGLIPFCVPECQDVRHTCPNCHYTVHVDSKM